MLRLFDGRPSHLGTDKSNAWSARTYVVPSRYSFGLSAGERVAVTKACPCTVTDRLCMQHLENRSAGGLGERVPISMSVIQSDRRSVSLPGATGARYVKTPLLAAAQARGPAS